MTKVCLIGVSGFGSIHYHDLMRQVEWGHMQIVGATVINQNEEREKCERLRAIGCELFTDYEAMLAKFGHETDICCVPTGIHLHAPMTVAALRAGANVFVEKPAAATIQDIRTMQAAERETGRFVAVGFQTMFARETLPMKQAILEENIGKVQAIKCRGLWPRLESYYERNRWAGRLKIDEHWVLDSPFNNAIAHQLNMVLFLAGNELRQSAKLDSVEAELYRGHDIESTDTAAFRIITREGLPVYFFVTHCPDSNLDPEIIVRGDKGHIHWTFKKTHFVFADGREETMECETWQELRDSLMERLRQRLHDPSTFICDLDIAGTHTLCVNAAHKSSPVHAVDPGLIRRLPQEGSAKVVIAGIDDAIAQAFEQEKLFTELGLPWARPGRKFQVEKLGDFFDGPAES